MQQAWLCAATDENSQIRGVHLLMALVGKPSLLKCDGLWPLLSAGHTQLERLLPLLNVQSDERPERQQEAALAQVSFDDEPRPDRLNRCCRQHYKACSINLRRTLPRKRMPAVSTRYLVAIMKFVKWWMCCPVGEKQSHSGWGTRRRQDRSGGGLALRIAEGNVPDSLKAVTLRTLDLGLLQAGLE